VVLYIEYVGQFVHVIWDSPLTVGERLRCYAELGRWLADRLRPRRVARLLGRGPRAGVAAT
jgi:hypothetical protein